MAMDVETPQIILGIDPGTRITGWGVITMEAGEPRGSRCGVIVPKARLPIEQRLQHIFSELGDVIAEFQPTVMAVGEARTVAMLAATLAGLMVRHYAPARIKQMVAGYGQGDKEQVRQMLGLQLGLAEPPSDLNASDALAVALCHAMCAREESLLAG
jgi:crossover junction endodeoxyribonuclease RuvC